MITSLTAEKLACARGERRLFDALSFQVRAGQALAVEGANGAGKTSLLRLLAGFLAPAAGRVFIRQDGKDSDDAEDRGKQVGWLGHHDGLKPQLTVAEQLAFYAGLYGPLRPASPATSPVNGGGKAEVLDRVGLTRQADLPCRYLSAGQRRRLALARLVISERPLWLLDEPFAALDTSGQALVAQLMAIHCGAGGIIIAATHDTLGLGNEILRIGNESLKL
jgi:heme exporter protein A